MLTQIHSPLCVYVAEGGLRWEAGVWLGVCGRVRGLSWLWRLRVFWVCVVGPCVCPVGLRFGRFGGRFLHTG